MASIHRIAFEASPALIGFRAVVGSANFFLNTVVVGLRTVQVSEPVKPPDLAVAWAKPLKASTYDECREFVLKMMMVAVIDALDQYLRKVGSIPHLVSHGILDDLGGRRFVREGDRERRLTIAERLDVLAMNYPDAVRPEWLATIHLLAFWRNRFVHHDYRFTIPPSVETRLTQASAYFNDEHSGCDILSLLGRFKAGSPPTLSDVSTLLAVVHRTLTSLDEAILFAKTGPEYANSLIAFLSRQSGDPTQFVKSIWQYGRPRTVGKLHALFLAHGGNDKGGRTSAPSITRDEITEHLGFGLNVALREFAGHR